MLFICSRTMLDSATRSYPYKLNTISIGEQYLSTYNKSQLDSIKSLSRNNLMLRFDDVLYQEENKYILAQKEDLKQAIEFYNQYYDKHNPILIGCAAGISRSAALAYIVMRSKHSCSESINIINPNIHYPNRLMLKLGSEMLGMDLNKEISELFGESFNFN